MECRRTAGNSFALRHTKAMDQDEQAKQRQRDEEAAFVAVLVAFFLAQAAKVAETIRNHGAGAAAMVFRPADWTGPLRDTVAGELIRLAALGIAAEIALGKQLASAKGIDLDEKRLQQDAEDQAKVLLAAALALGWWESIIAELQAAVEQALADGIGLGRDELEIGRASCREGE